MKLILKLQIKKQKKHANTVCPPYYFGETLIFLKDVLQAQKGES